MRRAPFLLAVLLGSSACSTGATFGIEKTEATGGPEGFTLVSADGNFEVVFAPGALSRRTRGIIRTHREFRPAGAVSPDQPAYEVSLEDCVIVQPAFVKLRHRIPEGQLDRLWLRIGQVIGDELQPIYDTTRADDWLEKPSPFFCANEGPLRASYLLTCARHYDELCPNHVCAGSEPVGAEAFCPNEPLLIQGWGETVGHGRVVATRAMQVAAADRGLDLRTACEPRDPAQKYNALARLAELSTGLRSPGLPTSETLLFEQFELGNLGLYRVPCWSLHAYRAIDADDPFFPANDFETPPGVARCCEFKVRLESVAGAPTSSIHRTQVAATGLGFHTEPFTSLLIPTQAVWGNYRGGAADPWLPLERARVNIDSLDVSGGWARARLGGALTPLALSRIPHPLCQTASPYCPPNARESATLLDFVLTFSAPDIDLDEPPDGLERFELGADGRVARCFDGDGTEVPALAAGAPFACAEDPRMRDGFSITFELETVPATIAGFE